MENAKIVKDSVFDQWEEEQDAGPYTDNADLEYEVDTLRRELQYLQHMVTALSGVMAVVAITLFAVSLIVWTLA